MRESKKIENDNLSTAAALVGGEYAKVPSKLQNPTRIRAGLTLFIKNNFIAASRPNEKNLKDILAKIST